MPSVVSLQPTSIRTMKADDLRPDPRVLMSRIAANSEQSGLSFGFIYGPLIHAPNGVPCATYKETSVYDPKTKELIHIEFETKMQAPDADIVVVVESVEKFSAFFEDLATQMRLRNALTYYLALNVMTPETLQRELTDKRPRALRRILTYRAFWGFGDSSALVAADKTAFFNRNELDGEFELEVEAKKNMLRGYILTHAGNFIMKAEKYKEMFPLHYEHLLKNESGYPEDRKEIVLPRDMCLKAKKFQGDSTVAYLSNF